MITVSNHRFKNIDELKKSWSLNSHGWYKASDSDDRVYLGRYVKIGEHVKIGERVKLGDSVYLAPFVTIGNDVELGDFTCVGHSVNVGNTVIAEDRVIIECGIGQCSYITSRSVVRAL